MIRPKVALVGPVTWRGSGAPSDLQLGLLSLAAVLRESGVAASLIDLNLLPGGDAERTDAVDAILAHTPDIVGLGTICNSYGSTLRLAEALKRERPALVIVLGGPQASVVDHSAITAFPFIDFVVRGEAEHSFPRLLDCLTTASDWTNIDGITYRQRRRVIRTPNALPIADLDALPLPAYDLYDDWSKRTFIALEAGRGCPFSCRFCSTNDFFRRRFRLKSAPVLVAQMTTLARHYRIRHFQLTHDMFTVDRKRVVAFCDELARSSERFEWRCSARTDCVDIPLLEQMAAVGCAGIFFGIETGSQRLQTIIDKNLDLREAWTILDAADQIGIETTASLITGYPGEERVDLHDTVYFFGKALSLDRCDPQLHLLAPLAATPIATEYRDQLTFVPLASDIAGDEEATPDPVEALLALAHPDQFSHCYAPPCPISRDYLAELRSFVLSLSVRAKGLAVALHTEAGGLLAVFDEWKRGQPATLTAAYYGSWSFFEQFLEHVAGRYVSDERIGVSVLSRFYRALASKRKSQLTNPFTEPSVQLASSVKLTSMTGDVVGVLSALRNGQEPEKKMLDYPCELASIESKGRRNSIVELPPLSATILRLCVEPVTVAQLTKELTEAQCMIGELTPAMYLLRALDNLQAQGMIEVQ